MTEPNTLQGPVQRRPDHAIVLRQLTRKTDIQRLTDINRDAMAPDLLSKWMEMYTPRSEAEGARLALEEAMKAREEGERDSNVKYGTMIAVVRSTTGEEAQEVIAGFIYWEEGYINVPSLRPSAATDAASAPSNPASDEEIARQARLALGTEIYAHSRQHYIKTIQWRRHVFVRRLMVDPLYQRMGIGALLLRHVTSHADQNAMPCWLYSRPAGVKLYEQEGFQAVGTTKLSTAELPGVGISLGMVRWEQGPGVGDW
jgi:GNAT superfamily N-acetyltransferase